MPIDPRQETWKIAQTNVDEAYSFAMAITDDWYRCQALAMVAWHTKSKPRFKKITKDAFKAASNLTNPNRRVSCSAWIIRAISKRGDIDLTETVEECLTDIRKEENPVRRSDGLLLLYEAIYSLPELRKLVFDLLWSSIDEINSWKKERLLGDLALVVATDDGDRAVDIANRITKNSIKRRTLEYIESRTWLGPHKFFPNYSKPVEAHPVR